MLPKRLQHYLLLFIIFVLFDTIQGKKKSPKRKIINWTSSGQLCDDKYGRYFDVKNLVSSRYNESVGVLNGPLVMKQKMDGLIQINLVLERVLSSGGRESVVSHTIQDFCQAVKEKQTHEVYSKYLLTFDYPDECPIQAGTYHITQMMANANDFPPDAIAVGKYVITITVVQDVEPGALMASQKDPILGCAMFNLSVENEN